MASRRVAPLVTAAVDGMTDAAFGIGNRDQARRELRALLATIRTLRQFVKEVKEAREDGVCPVKTDWAENALSRLDALSKGRGR